MDTAQASSRGQRFAGVGGGIALLLLVAAGGRYGYGLAQDATPAATPATGSPEASPMASPDASPAVVPVDPATAPTPTPPPPAAAAPVTLEAVDIAWNQTELTLPVGGTLTLVNLGAAEHNFAIEGYNDAAPVPMPLGGQPTPWPVPPDLAPGTYTYYCNVPGHQQLMRGTLTIQ